MAIKFVDTVRGELGQLHKIEVKDNEVIIFQIPQNTKDLNKDYIENAVNYVHEIMPEGKQALIMGMDIDIYAITSEDAVTIKLKGYPLAE